MTDIFILASKRPLTIVMQYEEHVHLLQTDQNEIKMSMLISEIL